MNLGVVPARLNSKRLPRKILADLNGKPLIAHVMERALKAKSLDKVILAVDSEETIKTLEQYNFDMVLTSSDHVSGTDRIAEVIDEIPDAEIIINVIFFIKIPFLFMELYHIYINIVLMVCFVHYFFKS